MDAVKFLKQKDRMCNSFSLCSQCPMSALKNNRNVSCIQLHERYPEEVVRIVEQWSKENPIITNAMKFNEVFGFMPAGSQTFYFVEPSGSYSKTIDWQDPYKEPEK